MTRAAPFDATWPAFVDGAWTTLGAARVPLLDSGVLYGRAAFTTLPVREGRLLFVREHRGRLARDAAALGLPFDAGAFDAALAAFAPRLPGDAGALRVHLSSGGAAQRGWLALLPRRVPLDDGRGVVLAISAHAAGGALGAHKTAARAALELARERAQADGADEALVHDGHGHFLGATAASLFVRRGGASWRLEARAVAAQELVAADEVLLVGSVRGVRAARAMALGGLGGDLRLPGPDGPLAAAARSCWEALLAAALRDDGDGRRTDGPR